MKTFVQFATRVAAILLPASLWGQRPAAVSTNLLTTTVTAAPTTAVTPSMIVMIENRARVLGNQTTASGTRYFAVRKHDLSGKKPDEVIKRLSPPPVASGEGVRRMEVVVDLQCPVTIKTTGPQPVNIGTTVVQGPIKNLEVHTSIFATDLTVVKK